MFGVDPWPPRKTADCTCSTAGAMTPEKVNGSSARHKSKNKNRKQNGEPNPRTEIKKATKTEALRGHFKKEVETEEEEDEVGRPGSELRGELADAAHGFEESGNGPIEDGNTDSHSDTADGATTSNEDGEGDRQHHADRGDEGIGELFLPLDEKRRD